MLEILFENNDYLIINKEAGIMVHDDGRGAEETISDIIIKLRPEMADIGEEQILYRDNKEFILKRPGIVHRLDRDTSGVLLIAKTQIGYDHAKKLFQDKNITKIYHAFHYGSPKVKRGIVQVFQIKSTKNISKYRTCGRSSEGARESISLYRVLSEGKAMHKNSVVDYSCIEWIPKTGRTHQIRLHAEYLQKPIIGDPVYGKDPKEDCKKGDTLFGFNRHALHARRLVFRDLDDKEIDIMAPYPEDFEKAFSIIKK